MSDAAEPAVCRCLHALTPVCARRELIEPEVFGAKGLEEDGLFPYRTYKMLGGMPFDVVDIA